MSALTRLYEIAPDLFTLLRQQRQLPWLVGYLLHPAADEELGLPAQPPFRSCPLDKAWGHFEPFLNEVAPAIWNAMRAYAHPITPKKLDAAYWQPLEIAWCLGAVNHALSPRMNGIESVEVRSGVYIIPVSEMDKVAALLAQRASQRQRLSAPWYDGDDAPFDSGTLDYTIGHFCQWLSFVMQAAQTEQVVLRLSS